MRFRLLIRCRGFLALDGIVLLEFAGTSPPQQCDACSSQ
jgi:hypothetical protein